MSKFISKNYYIKNPLIVRAQLYEWQRRSISNLIDLIVRKVRDQNVEKVKRSVKNLYQGVLIDMLNGGDLKIGTSMIVRIIAAKINVRSLEVQRCLAYPYDYRPSTSFNKKLHVQYEPNKLQVEHEPNRFTEIVLPSARLDEILSYNLSDQELIELVERYAFLMPELGFFWSIHPDAYLKSSQIDQRYTHKVIEGFASPLNHNLDNWCSVYSQDIKLGSMGTFQDVIRSEITPENKSIRWIINPAYTEYIIDVAHREIIDRMARYPEDEFLLLLPGWPHLPIVEWLINNNSICWYMEGGAYRVFDHITNEDVNVPVGVNMIIGYVRSSKATLPLPSFIEDMVTASTLAGANPKPIIITKDDIRTNNVSNIKL